MAKSGKKLVIAIVVLVLAIALATTATFAWFTMNQNVGVNNIDVNVTSQTAGLYVSLDGKTFDTTLDVKALQADILKAIELKDVTAKTQTATEKFALKNQDATPAVEKSYLALDIYFRGTAAFAIDLDLSREVNIGTSDNPNMVQASRVTGKDTYINYAEKTVPTEDKFKEYYGQNAELPATADPHKDQLKANAANAARVAFETETKAAADGSAAEYSYKIWNPNADLGFSGGSRNMAQDYIALYQGKTINYNDTTDVMAEEKADTAFEELVTLKEVDPANRIYEAKVTVYIYLEGTDSDCFDAILSTKADANPINVNLAFKINKNSLDNLNK